LTKTVSAALEATARRQRAVVLLSGAGQTLAALLRAAADQQLALDIVAVISDRADAGGLNIAQAASVPALVLTRTSYGTKAAFEQALIRRVAEFAPDWIVLAGFMRVLGAKVCQAWSKRAINLHPALLPKYPGLDTHARAIAAGDAEAGASVHYLTEELDGGPLIGQVRTAILPGDTPSELAARIKPLEQQLLIDSLRGLMRASQHH
jgi:phosphoribosylglycinamide formyltransferase 1